MSKIGARHRQDFVLIHCHKSRFIIEWVLKHRYAFSRIWGSRIKIISYTDLRQLVFHSTFNSWSKSLTGELMNNATRVSFIRLIRQSISPTTTIQVLFVKSSNITLPKLETYEVIWDFSYSEILIRVCITFECRGLNMRQRSSTDIKRELGIQPTPLGSRARTSSRKASRPQLIYSVRFGVALCALGMRNCKLKLWSIEYTLF